MSVILTIREATTRLDQRQDPVIPNPSPLTACLPNETYQPRRVLRAVGWMRLLAKQPIVVGMATYPKPDESVWRFDREGAVVGSDPSRPESADLLEMKGGMPGILPQARIRLIGEIANLGRQGSI